MVVLLTSILGGIIVAVNSWMLATAWSLDGRVSVIESNRFTDRDAQALEQRLLSQCPPVWVVDWMKRLESQLETLSQITNLKQKALHAHLTQNDELFLN